MTKLRQLVAEVKERLLSSLSSIKLADKELTLECEKPQLLQVLSALKNEPSFLFNQLIDLCAVDYLHYGCSDWETDAATEQGFSRAVQAQAPSICLDKPRFAVVYHLLSTQLNHRVRVKIFLDETQLVLPSAVHLWQAADWFEREAYDLFGVLFEGHPDLRRILTDYGFIGYPLRKDFPLSGQVEMRYDAHFKKVIYEAVDIEPRILVPKVIRNDNRYQDEKRYQSERKEG